MGRPDRIAFYSYAHVTWIQKSQRGFEKKDLPPAERKVAIMLHASRRFGEAGYRFLGLDHFALPEDELCHAADSGDLRRNFMGYTVQPASDQIGVGVTSIGDIAGAYVANQKKLVRYQNSSREGRLPIERGILRTAEDELRRDVIHRIICTLKLDFAWLEQRHAIDPRAHFTSSLEALEPMAADGLVELQEGGLQVTQRGRFFLRNVCMPFDSYLAQPGDRPVYSRTV